MKKNSFKKSLSVIILVFFVGASVTACDCNKTTENISEEQNWNNTHDENLAEYYPIDQLCGLVEPEDWWVDAKFDLCEPTGTFPERFDWRDISGGLPPVRNQGSCGSCWAFGTIAALECAIKIRDGMNVDLSEQWLVSCNQDGYSCSGGWWCHEYFKLDGTKKDPCGDSGAVLEEYFPYTASNSPCNCPYPHDYFIEDWAYVGPTSGVASVEQIKQAIYEYGPVSVAVCASTFGGYSGGVFSGPSCTSINHAVCLVGWDDNQGTNGVWFLRNSWGSGWGEGGYMRIEYGVCNVGYRTVRIDYAGFINYPPDEPSNPDPENGEMSVSVHADLSWTGGDPNSDSSVTYDVYLEEDDTTPDVLVSDDQTETTFNPGTMEYDTHYYWQIISTDNYGESTQGPVWDFTTRPHPNNSPYPPSNPSPFNGSIDCDINIDLSWTGGDPDPGDIVVYDVYLDADNPYPTTKISDDQTGTTFDPGILDHDTTYYWRVHAKDNHNAVQRGPNWHFTTKEGTPNRPPGVPTIDGPTNGKAGTECEYTFKAVDPDGDDVKFYIEWGDASSETTTFSSSGKDIRAKHTWNEEGTYIIKAVAEDSKGLIGTESTLSVTMTRNRVANTPFFKLFQIHPILFQILQQKLIQLLGL